MGVGGGVGVDEAAGVRGYSGVEGQGDLRRDLPQLPADLVDDLPAGRPAGVYTLGRAEPLEGGVVVDGQADPGEIGLRPKEGSYPSGAQ